MLALNPGGRAAALARPVGALPRVGVYPASKDGNQKCAPCGARDRADALRGLFLDFHLSFGAPGRGPLRTHQPNRKHAFSLLLHASAAAAQPDSLETDDTTPYLRFALAAQVHL